MTALDLVLSLGPAGYMYVAVVLATRLDQGRVVTLDDLTAAVDAAMDHGFGVARLDVPRSA